MPTVEEIRSIKAAIMAGMETGNIDRARSVLIECEAMYPDLAARLSMDVVNTYGVVLL